jgi:hypothetical protein
VSGPTSHPYPERKRRVTRSRPHAQAIPQHMAPAGFRRRAFGSSRGAGRTVYRDQPASTRRSRSGYGGIPTRMVGVPWGSAPFAVGAAPLVCQRHDPCSTLFTIKHVPEYRVLRLHQSGNSRRARTGMPCRSSHHPAGWRSGGSLLHKWGALPLETHRLARI